MFFENRNFGMFFEVRKFRFELHFQYLHIVHMRILKYFI